MKTGPERTQAQSERYHREAMASLQELLDMPLHGTMNEEAGKIYRSGPATIRKPKKVKYRPDGLVAGSPEAVERMAEYVRQVKEDNNLGSMEDMWEVETGLDLSDGQPEQFEDNEEELEVSQLNLGLFSKLV